MSQENVDRMRAAITAMNRRDIDVPLTAVAQFKDGLISDFIDYGDREQALEAVGLRG